MGVAATRLQHEISLSYSFVGFFCQHRLDSALKSLNSEREIFHVLFHRLKTSVTGNSLNKPPFSASELEFFLHLKVILQCQTIQKFESEPRAPK